MDTKMLMISVVMGVGLFGKVELPNLFIETLPKMIVYQYNKNIETQRNIGQNDEEYKIISRFLKENKTGWENDHRSYAPGIVFWEFWGHNT
jgi:hypothetical protein